MSDIDFTAPPGSPLNLKTDFGGTQPINNTITWNAWANANNQAPLPGGPPTVIPPGSVQAGLMTFNTSSFNGSESVSFTRSGNYALFGQAILTFGDRGGTVSYDGNIDVTPAPAPGGLALALCGLPALGMGYWRRRQAKACDALAV
jgi:hypothetical protein